MNKTNGIFKPRNPINKKKKKKKLRKTTLL